MKMVRLIPSPGCDEANIGTSRYRIHDDGFFYIPSEENIQGLLKVGGFTTAPDQAATVTVTAARIAELEREESELRAAKPAPTIKRLVMPG
jgi:hypothetical protein